jgi:methionine synthase I (cobalamin-dependent)
LAARFAICTAALTNTYGANFEKLKVFGLEHKVKEIHKAAVQIAKRAANVLFP